MVADLAQEWGMTLLACLTAAGAQLMPLLRRVLNDHQALEGAVLPDMILRRIPYRLELRSLQEPYRRPPCRSLWNICRSAKKRKTPAPAKRQAPGFYD